MLWVAISLSVVLHLLIFIKLNLKQPYPLADASELVFHATLLNSMQETATAELGGQHEYPQRDQGVSSFQAKRQLFPHIVPLLISEDNSTEISEYFLNYDEVDTPAMPTSDWALPIEWLIENRIQRINVQIWIYSDGSIADIRIISSTPRVLTKAETDRVVSMLSTTEVAPALKNDIKVASQRILEIVLE